MTLTEEQKRFVRFVVVGVGGAVLLFGLSYAFDRLGAAPIWGYAVAYMIAFAVVYSLQRAWTFGARHRHAHAFPRYLALQVFCAGLSAGLGQALTSWTASPALMTSAICTVVASAASFVGSSFWVFADRHAEPSA